jgi:hypothetical protein
MTSISLSIAVLGKQYKRTAVLKQKFIVASLKR